MATPGPLPLLAALRRVILVVGVSGLAGLLIAGLVLPVAAGLGLVARESASGFSQLPNEVDTEAPLPERSRILDADGNLIATFYEENRVYRPLDEIAETMQQAILAIEDHRFYHHGPIDFQGTARAFVTNVEAGEVAEGGSTLTQQYAKKLAEAQAETEEERLAVIEESYVRKLRELRLAVGLEQQLSKDEILEGYLNIAYFGGGAHGVEAAARRYFSTSASDLTLEQAALLAGLVQSPVAYDPTRSPERALSRRDVVLNRMHDVGFINADELAEALDEELELDERVTPNGCGGSSAPFFCEYVVQELLRLEELGETPEERTQALYQGGLTIRTTLDRSTQRAAQRAIEDRVAPTDTAAAALATVEPGTGQIKALAQSRDYGTDTEAGQTTLNLAVDREMRGGNGAQAGSAFKVWVVAAAIEQGLSLNTSFNSPAQMEIPENQYETCDGTYRSTGTWRVGNYSASLNGNFNIRTGTERSVNTFFAQLEQRTGICDPWRIATDAGLTMANGDPLGQAPSFTLGPYEVSPLSMAEAYAMFAARGEHCESYAITRVRDRDGEDYYEADSDCTRVLDEGVADGVNDVLKGVLENPGGTGARMRLEDGREAAGKTGTTNNAVAVWWVGYVPQMSTAVAIYDPDVDPETGRLETLHGRTYNGEVIADACGGCIPGPIWKQMMDSALEDVEPESFTEPDPSVVQGVQIEVPDVRGRSESDARSILDDAGFGAHVADRVPHSLPEGVVVATQPGPGSRFGSGSSVGLVLSTGVPPRDDDDDDDDDRRGPPDDPPGRGNGGDDDDDDDGDDDDDDEDGDDDGIGDELPDGD